MSSNILSKPNEQHRLSMDERLRMTLLRETVEFSEPAALINVFHWPSFDPVALRL
jgi:hypothetical protein